MPSKTKADTYNTRWVSALQHLAFESSQKRLDEAGEWLLRLETAERVEEVWPAFEAWLAEDPRNRDAFQQMEEASSRLDRLSELRPPGEEVDADLLAAVGGGSDASENEGTGTRAPWVGAVAAIPIMAVLVPLIYQCWTIWNGGGRVDAHDGSVAVALMVPVVLMMAVVLISDLVSAVSLAAGGQVRARIQAKGLGLFELHTSTGVRAPQGNSRSLSKKPAGAPQATRLRTSRRWPVLVILAAILVIIPIPSWWWSSQPKFWRVLISDELGETLSQLLQGSREPLEVHTGKQTQDKLELILKLRISELQKKGRHSDEVWIINHYWRYWLSDTIDDYLSLNNEFVAKGGRIHRMFVVSQEDLAARDGKLEQMLRRQCSIARNPTTNVISNDFQVWLAHPDIKSSEPYERVAAQFEHLPGTGAAFERFDAVQFNDALFFSDSFNGSKEILGRSTWLFDPDQIMKIHLEDLFKAKTAIATEFKCDRFDESFKEATGHAPGGARTQ